MSLPAIFEERERLHRARIDSSGRFHRPVKPSPVGVVDQTELPSLRLGVDSLAKRCDGCGSEFLHVTPPLAEERFGAHTCGMCGRVLAHLLPPPALVTPRRAASAAPPEPSRRPAATPPRLPEPLSAPDWRRPGCALPCRRDQHSPEIHEAYGRRLALEELAAREVEPRGVVRTGPLAIDFDAYRATVDGRDIRLTPMEMRIISFLARRIGQVCWHADTIEAVWGADAPFVAPRTLRVHTSRMWPKLGPARPLIETVPGIGYRLKSEPPIDPPVERTPAPSVDWRGVPFDPIEAPTQGGTDADN